MATYSKNISVLCMFIMSIFFTTGCGGKGADTPQEDKIVFTINPDPGTTIFPALSATQSLGITVTSTLPASGVLATISVTQETNNAVVFSQTLSSTTANFSTLIQNLAPGIVCNVVVTVTSKTTASNTATKSFKIARK